MKSNRKAKTPMSFKLGVALLASGIFLLAASYILTSVILAFSGLGLTFWGAIFLFITPSKYVEANLLPTTSLPTYLTIERIIKQYNLKGKALHITSFPQEVYLPEHLKGLKAQVAYIPEAEENTTAPPIEELIKEKFIFENPKGLLLIPPGSSLSTEIEKKSKTPTQQTNLNLLCETLPKNILDNFDLAKEITMEQKENDIILKVTGSIYQDLYTEARNLKSIHLLGCPLISAVACTIAKASGKPVIIQAIKYTPDNPTIAAKYTIIKSD